MFFEQATQAELPAAQVPVQVGKGTIQKVHRRLAGGEKKGASLSRRASRPYTSRACGLRGKAVLDFGIGAVADVVTVERNGRVGRGTGHPLFVAHLVGLVQADQPPVLPEDSPPGKVDRARFVAGGPLGALLPKSESGYVKQCILDFPEETTRSPCQLD